MDRTILREHEEGRTTYLIGVNLTKPNEIEFICKYYYNSTTAYLCLCACLPASLTILPPLVFILPRIDTISGNMGEFIWAVIRFLILKFIKWSPWRIKKLQVDTTISDKSRG